MNKKQRYWQYDEFRQVGKDYSLPDEVGVYDSSHADFRDIEKESKDVLDRLGVGRDSTVIDFGSGTGVFAIQAARRCAHVHAVDISPAMLEFAQSKAALARVSNITFCHAGFLTYQHTGDPVDVVTSTFSFHHLPDFWKGVALARVFQLLKPGGQFYLHDVIIEEKNAVGNISAFIDKQAAAGGDFLRDDAIGHFRDEFSTYDWVMDGLLQRAGLSILSKVMSQGVLGTYYCKKTV